MHRDQCQDKSDAFIWPSMLPSGSPRRSAPSDKHPAHPHLANFSVWASAESRADTRPENQTIASPFAESFTRAIRLSLVSGTFAIWFPQEFHSEEYQFFLHCRTFGVVNTIQQQRFILPCDRICCRANKVNKFLVMSRPEIAICRQSNSSLQTSQGCVVAATNWDEIVCANVAGVTNAAIRLLGSIVAAEDVAQEVFLEACRRWDSSADNARSGLLKRMAVCRAPDVI